jgi:hypothetical protein
MGPNSKDTPSWRPGGAAQRTPPRPSPGCGSRLGTWWEDSGSMAGLLAMGISLPVSVVLCIVLYATHSRTNWLVGLALALFGLPVLLYGLMLTRRRNRQIAGEGGCMTLGAILLGAAALVFAFFVFFRPEHKIAKTLMLSFQRGVKSHDFSLVLNVSPAEYRVGERGAVTVDITNQSNVTVEFSEMVLGLPKDFFDGFVVDFPTTPPHLQYNQQSIGGDTIVLSGEGTRIEPGETFTARVEIVANLPGNYSGKFTFMPVFSEESEALGTLQVKEKLTVTILPDSPKGP